MQFPQAKSVAEKQNVVQKFTAYAEAISQRIAWAAMPREDEDSFTRSFTHRLNLQIAKSRADDSRPNPVNISQALFFLIGPLWDSQPRLPSKLHRRECLS